MKLKILFAFLVVSAMAPPANAQTKMSGTAQCGKPDPAHSIQIGDRPNHSFNIEQGKCTWITPVEIAGIKSKQGVYTTLAETSGNRVHYRFYFVDTMANGDKAFYRGDAAMTVKDGVPQSCVEKFVLVGGTGKLKGLKGKGTNTFKAVASDGSGTWVTEGEYELPQ
jgi:hypothetical protein